MASGNRCWLIACICCWFTASAICTSSAKLALLHLAPKSGSCALTLTSLQFVISASVSVVACLVLNRRPPSAVRELLSVSLAYTLGFLLLNQSLGRLQASFTETVRGLEPLTSFVLAWLLSARGSKLQGASAGALLTVLAGAALSVWAQPAFDPRGFAYGLLANCAFSSRALLVTLLQDAQRKRAVKEGALSPSATIDSVGLFAAQHVCGLLLLLPWTFMSEGSHCVAGLSRKPAALHAALWSALGFLSYNFVSLYVLLLLDAVSHAVRSRPAACLSPLRTRTSHHLTARATRGAWHPRRCAIRVAVPSPSAPRASCFRPPSPSPRGSALCSSSVGLPATRSLRMWRPSRLKKRRSDSATPTASPPQKMTVRVLSARLPLLLRMTGS